MPQHSVEPAKVGEIFDYLSAPRGPQAGDGVIVFGRQDSRLVDTLEGVAERGAAEYAVLSGGLGKDSGDLIPLGIPEAHYLAVLAMQRGLHRRFNPLLLETRSENNLGNSRYSLELIQANNLRHGVLVAIIHATSVRRYLHNLTRTVEAQGLEVSALGAIPTAYSFDPTNPIDQIEALSEVTKLATFGAQDGYPEDWTPEIAELAEYAQLAASKIR